MAIDILNCLWLHQSISMRKNKDFKLKIAWNLSVCGGGRGVPSRYIDN